MGISRQFCVYERALFDCVAITAKYRNHDVRLRFFKIPYAVFFTVFAKCSFHVLTEFNMRNK